MYATERGHEIFVHPRTAKNNCAKDSFSRSALEASRDISITEGKVYGEAVTIKGEIASSLELHPQDNPLRYCFKAVNQERHLRGDNMFASPLWHLPTGPPAIEVCKEPITSIVLESHNRVQREKSTTHALTGLRTRGKSDQKPDSTP